VFSLSSSQGKEISVNQSTKRRRRTRDVHRKKNFFSSPPSVVVFDIKRTNIDPKGYTQDSIETQTWRRVERNLREQ